jgi:hypothetical protein
MHDFDALRFAAPADLEKPRRRIRTDQHLEVVVEFELAEIVGESVHDVLPRNAVS